MTEWIVRACQEADLDQVSVLAEKLVRFHAELDPERYLSHERVRQGYRWWLGQELVKEEVVLVVLAQDARVGGYAYGRLEQRDWMRLLDVHGELHDIYVDDDLRGGGNAAKLVLECVRLLEQRGAPRVILSTAWSNERARRFFEKLGFRPTMLEMTRG
jgi:ribosomal protein S18 acetylase RimI-like enzyme